MVICREFYNSSVSLKEAQGMESRYNVSESMHGLLIRDFIFDVHMWKY